MILEGGAPRALIGLRHRGGHRWQLVIGWTVSPRSWAPTAAGCLLTSLRALQSDVDIYEWDQPPPGFAREATRYPLYQIDLQTDYRAYWRDSNQGFERRLRRAASRTRKFTFEVDAAGIAALTIRTWGERWGEQDIASDLLLAADYHAFALIDDGLQCAGLTAFADGEDLIVLTTARLFAYESCGVGTRVHELAIDWAYAQGFKTITLGERSAEQL